MIRALIRKPQLLLADEPIGHLDPLSSGIVVRALDNYRQAGGSVVLVTHHLDHPDFQPDHEFVLEHGRLQKPEVVT